MGFPIGIILVGSGIIGQPVERAIPRFLKNMADVFSENAETHEIKAPKDGNQDGHGCPAGDRLPRDDAVQYMENEEESGKSGKKSDIK